MRGCLWFLAALAIAADGGAAAAASVRNPTNDSLLAMPKTSQLAFLARMVRHKCAGKEAFYMGETSSGPARGTAYWSIACEDGHSYIIQISRDKKGTTFIADCKVLEGTGRACFQHF